jgi:LmeA-like phospholipid-binding
VRKWLIALTALVVVVVAADFGLRLLAEYSVGRGLQNALSLSERPSVSMDGFPFIPELVTGNVDDAGQRMVKRGPCVTRVGDAHPSRCLLFLRASCWSEAGPGSVP